MQVQKTEATRRELGLQCDALAQKETNLLQRENLLRADAREASASAPLSRRADSCCCVCIWASMAATA